MSALIALALLATSASNATAAEVAAVAAEATDPATAADVAAIDAVVRKAHDSLGGPAEKGRDWTSFRAQFRPDARIIAEVPHNGLKTVDAFEDTNRVDYFVLGITDRVTRVRTDVFGDTAQAWVEFTRSFDGSPRHPEGVSAIQLVRTADNGWTIFSMISAVEEGGSGQTDYTVQSQGSEVDAASQTLDQAMAALSGPASQQRDWALFKMNFADDARLFDPARKSESQSIDKFIAAAAESIQSTGLTKELLVRHVLQFGDVAQVWASYESRQGEGGQAGREIVSVQLARMIDGQWRVRSVLTSPEVVGKNDLPREMLR